VESRVQIGSESVPACGYAGEVCYTLKDAQTEDVTKSRSAKKARS